MKGKSYVLGAAYGMGRDATPRGEWDMKCIGGHVTVIGNKFSTPKKLWVRKEHTSTVFVKTARMRFSALRRDGTVEGEKNNRQWAELRIPEGYTRAQDTENVVVHDIVLMARHRVTGEPEDRTSMSGRILR